MDEFLEFGRCFEDFTVNSIIHHSIGKTIFESDNNMFSLLTMNHHPVHLDVNYAAKNQHGKILVVGTLIFSIAVGLTVSDISGKAIANLEYESIIHLAPVHINDTIYVKTKVLDKIVSKSKPDRGIVYVETIGFNQNDLEVIKFRRKVLVKRKTKSYE